jgi:hypothetical protein
MIETMASPKVNGRMQKVAIDAAPKDKNSGPAFQAGGPGSAGVSPAWVKNDGEIILKTPPARRLMPHCF